MNFLAHLHTAAELDRLLLSCRLLFFLTHHPSAYMFKTWRLEEDKTIQVTALARILVKELADKKETLRTDTLKKEVKKMQELEADSIRKMVEISGAQVRFESFKKKKRELYKAYKAH